MGTAEALEGVGREGGSPQQSVAVRREHFFNGKERLVTRR